MLRSPEVKYITTTEQGEYWGGFFGESLRPAIIKDSQQPRVYYKPRLYVFDRRITKLDFIKKNFGGITREQTSHIDIDMKEIAQNFSNLGSGFMWTLSKTDSILSLLEELQPYMVSQQELVEIMIHFLSAKQQRREEYRAPKDYRSELADKREAEEGEFLRLFRLARGNRYTIKKPFSPANMAGILDSCSNISIRRSERSRGRTEYSAAMEIHSANVAILEAFGELYSGTIYPIKWSNPPIFSDERFFCGISRSEDIRNLLGTTLPYLNLQKKQAEVALAFLDTQQTLTGGNWRHPKGDVSGVLKRYSTPSVDLITILREGFYSEMHRLNHK